MILELAIQPEERHRDAEPGCWEGNPESYVLPPAPTAGWVAVSRDEIGDRPALVLHRTGHSTLLATDAVSVAVEAVRVSPYHSELTIGNLRAVQVWRRIGDAHGWVRGMAASTRIYSWLQWSRRRFNCAVRQEPRALLNREVGSAPDTEAVASVRRLLLRWQDRGLRARRNLDNDNRGGWRLRLIVSFAAGIWQLSSKVGPADQANGPYQRGQNWSTESAHHSPLSAHNYNGCALLLLPVGGPCHVH